jgi:hypothetical protein
MKMRHASVIRLLALVGLAALDVGLLPAAAEPCITIVIHEDDRLGFRNACGVCKQAVWSWGAGQSYFSRDGKVEGVWQGGETWTRKYRVPPHGEITVDEESPIGKLLREDRCPAPKQ